MPLRSTPDTLQGAWRTVVLLVMSAYRNGNDPAPGMVHLHHILDTAPGDPALLADAHFYLGMAHRCRSDEPQARAAFTAALRHLPTHHGARLATATGGRHDP